LKRFTKRDQSSSSSKIIAAFVRDLPGTIEWKNVKTKMKIEEYIYYLFTRAVLTNE